MEVRGHLELRTAFTDGTVSRMENIRYLVVNAPSAYNVLVGRPTLNRLRAVSSTRHMKMKLPDLGGKVITIKLDPKEAKRCYENNLKMKRGVFMVTTRAQSEEGVAPSEIVARERRPEPAAEALERRVEYKYNPKVKPRQFQVVDLVMRKAHPYQLENKLSPKWTGPSRVTEALGNGAYRLETLEGSAIPHTWNATNLKFYFS